MVSTYIATFYAHIGAVRFNKLQKELGNESRMMPVPRSLSSSCGTCVQYSCEVPIPEVAMTDEIEQIVLLNRSEDGSITYTSIPIN